MRERQDAVVDYCRKVFASFEDADKADARYDAEELRRRILGPISSQTD